ncbi:MAG: zf-HC2 domain-containing protein [Candidatus Aminicenantes bacterium]|nr:zf-HC2 domain-containing protein [Candidatus Aminicenantes bacterium]
MDHQKVKELISSYHDRELSEEQKKQVEEHLRHCDSCRREWEEMKKFEEVMNQMELKKPPKETWQVYWSSVYNRLERHIGWILLSIGAIILLFYGGYKAVEGMIQDPTTPMVLKVGILVVLGGLVVLLVSIIRERIFVRKRERYKEVEK